jgi:hypothetical protein
VVSSKLEVLSSIPVPTTTKKKKRKKKFPPVIHTLALSGFQALPVLSQGKETHTSVTAVEILRADGQQCAQLQIGDHLPRLCQQALKLTCGGAVILGKAFRK